MAAWTAVVAAGTVSLSRQIGRGLRRYGDPFVIATGVLAVSSIVWFSVNLAGPWGPPALGWLPGPLALGLAGIAIWRLSGLAALPAAARRFWRYIALATALIAIGSGMQSFCVITGLSGSSAPNDAPFASYALFLAGILLTLWALLRLPAAARTRADWVRLILDGATVMIGAILFTWYWALAPLFAHGRGNISVWTMLVVAVFVQVALAAIVKVLLAGTGPVDSGALRVLSLCLVAGALSTGITPLIAEMGHLAAAELVSAPIAFIDAWAVVQQRRAARATRTATGPPRLPKRPYSLLPYLAVALTHALLVYATVGRPDGRTPVVVTGAILVTSLVAVRQLAAFMDIARLLHAVRQHEDRLHRQASHDSLTLLANRNLFGERLRVALGRDDGNGGSAVLLIDLDDFKIVNDTLGHTVGDGLLIAVAGRLRSCVRSVDTVARLGGDEFAVLLVNVTRAAALEHTERILASLTRPFAAHGHSLMVQASIGVAQADAGDDPERLLRNADIAMYAAKEQGKSQYAQYVPGMHTRLQEQALLGAQLHKALDRGELHLLYQPIVELPSGRITGVEALVRWRHPVRGLLMPARFIPAAERTGLIVPLGRWVLDRACRQAAAWQRADPDAAPITINVNVSARQMQESGFAAEVAATLARTGLDPARLTIEATESAVLKGGQVLRTLRDLNGTGVRLALDDFGTGQSSLGLLRTCPVDILKLDKSFVDEITDATRRPAVATAIAQMAHALDLDAVAEGIETATQAVQLRRLGYRFGQGYYFGPPLQADEIMVMSGVAPRPNGADRTSGITL